jgi:ribonuclease BN (tRNA processing enzyme)
MASRYEPTLITFLGTSFTHRFPLGDCKCDQCAEVRQGAFRRRNTSVLLDSDRKLFLLDCGPGLADTLRDLIPTRVFVTHTHPDHFAGISQLRPSTRINLLHGETVGRCDFQPFAVQHAKDVPTVGYEITVPGGMTIIFAPDFYRINNEDVLDDADLAILCGSSLKEDIKYGDNVGHQSMLASIRMCNKHKVKNIIFTHVGHIGLRHLDIENKLKEMAKEEGYGGEVVLAYDGYQVRLSKKGLALEKSFTEIFKGCDDLDPVYKHIIAKAWLGWNPKDDILMILKSTEKNMEAGTAGGSSGGSQMLHPSRGDVRAEGHSYTGQDAIMELSEDMPGSASGTLEDFDTILGGEYTPAELKEKWKRLAQINNHLKQAPLDLLQGVLGSPATEETLLGVGEAIIERLISMKSALFHPDAMQEPAKEFFDKVCDRLKAKGKEVPIEKAFSDEELRSMMDRIEKERA